MTLGLAPVAPETLQGRLDLAQLPVEPAEGRPLVGDREPVDEVDVARGVEKPLGLVLAVDDGDARRELAQEAHRHEGAVDGGPPLSARLDLPPQDHLVPVEGQAVGLEPRRGVLPLDDGLYHRPLLARADEIGGGPPTEEQPEGVDQDRLPGPGLPGQEGETRAQLELQGGDQRDVVDT